MNLLQYQYYTLLYRNTDAAVRKRVAFWCAIALLLGVAGTIQVIATALLLALLLLGAPPTADLQSAAGLESRATVSTGIVTEGSATRA